MAIISQQRDAELPVEIHWADNVVPAGTQYLGTSLKGPLKVLTSETYSKPSGDQCKK